MSFALTDDISSSCVPPRGASSCPPATIEQLIDDIFSLLGEIKNQFVFDRDNVLEEIDSFCMGCEYCEGLSNAGQRIEQIQNGWNKTKAKRASDLAWEKQRLMKYGLQDIVHLFVHEKQDMVA